MVTIEVLSSTLLKNERGFRQSKKNQPDLIESLAKDAAATLIQARIRGIIIRKSVWCYEKVSIGCQVEQANEVEDQECTMVSIACQMQPPLLLESYTQTESNQSTKKRREAAILEIYLECKIERSVIEVDGKEVVYILKEMGLIGPKEFEGLLKAASVQNRQHLHKSQAITYPLSISSVQDFETDLVSSWIELNEAAHRTPTVLMPSKKRTQFVLNENVSRAFNSSQSLVECPSEFITFLIDNPFALSYSKLTSYKALCALDIEVENPIDTREHLTIIDYLSKELKQRKTFSWKRERISLAYQLIKRVSQWENQSCKSNSELQREEDSHTQAKRLHEANLKIIELQTELQLLKETQLLTSSKNEVPIQVSKEAVPKKESKKNAQVKPSTTSRKGNDAAPSQRPIKQKTAKKKNILNTVNLTLSPLGKKTKPNATTRLNPKLRKSTSGICRNSKESKKSTRSKTKPPPRSNKDTSSNNIASTKEPDRNQTTADEKFNKIMERLNLY